MEMCAQKYASKKCHITDDIQNKYAMLKYIITILLCVVVGRYVTSI